MNEHSPLTPVQSRAYAIRQEGLPEEFHVLLKRLPRDSWDGHPGFRQPTRNWLGAHRMFRRIAERIRGDLASYLDNRMTSGTLMVHLSHYGDALVRNLHGHHHFEDTSYFPELREADPRFARGLDILGRDHEVVDKVLHDFTRQANDLIGRYKSNKSCDKRRIDQIHSTAIAIERLLKRHLADEEELVVPIILHHRLRG